MVFGECVSANQDTSSALFTVENVAINGDEATAIVTVKGQEDEVSTYGLTREAGEWKISDFPSDDQPAGGDGAEPEPEPVEEPEPEPAPTTPKALVTEPAHRLRQRERQQRVRLLLGELPRGDGGRPGGMRAVLR